MIEIESSPSWWEILVTISLSTLFILFLYLTRFCYIIYQKNERKKAIRKGERTEGLFPRGTGGAGKVGMMAVLGSGGHTAEMIRLLESLDMVRYSPRMYVVSVTDSLSQKKIEAFEKERGKNQPFYVYSIGRSREVGQSYFTSIFTTLSASLDCFKLFLFHLPQTPDLLLCNGPGTCVPVCWASLLPSIFTFKNTKLVYVESLARVNDLSLSAKLLYVLVDRLFVQWPKLEEKYSLVEFRGRLS